jgi:hypothetical protein
MSTFVTLDVIDALESLLAETTWILWKRGQLGRLDHTSDVKANWIDPGEMSY